MVDKKLEKKLEQAYSRVEVLPVVVETKNGKFPAGKVIFDIQKGVIGQASDNLFFIRNKELVDKIEAMFYKITITNVYINKSGNTFYFDGYFPDMYITDHNGVTLFIGFQIGNSYSGRFLPFVTLSAYNYKHGSYIRTHLPAIQITRKNWAADEIEIEEDNIRILKLLPEAQSTGYSFNSTLEHLPQKYFSYAEDQMQIYVLNYGQNLYSFLLWVAEVTKYWANFSYEVATKFQKQQYIRSLL